MKTELLVAEQVFLNRSLYREAERHFALRNSVAGVIDAAVTSVSSDAKGDESTVKVSDLLNRLSTLEKENGELRSLLSKLEAKVSQLEGSKAAPAAAPAPVAPTAPAAAAAKKDDDDFDLFDDEEEEDDSEEKKRITEERLKAYASKKSNKPSVVAKSTVLLDVKVWDDETNMEELEAKVREISLDGLVWGSSKLIDVAYGVKKLQIGCVIEDEKISTNDLEEKICEFEDYVQSVDIAAFNKV